MTNSDQSATTALIEARRKYSQERHEALRLDIQNRCEALDLQEIFVFTAGSVARGEASQYSDVDLFVGSAGSQTRKLRTLSFQLFSRLIESVATLQFPELSGDCRYLQVHSVPEVLKRLGSPEDDQLNNFTFRMLLLLESKYTLNEEAYQKAIESIIATYFTDYPKHESDFYPRFLINDVVRYWKTLTLNYENKRRQRTNPESLMIGDTAEARTEAKVKNFKLKYSRMLTCFATVAAIGADLDRCNPTTIESIVRLTPLERLDSVCEKRPVLAQRVHELEDLYSRFLSMTAEPTETLHARFQDSDSKRQLFLDADAFGQSMFELLRALDDSSDRFMRMLVI